MPPRHSRAKGGLIRFEGVTKKFGAQTVLDSVTLDIREGETLVIIGRSGCGKSVLLKCVIGLMRPDAGRILVGGRDISRLEGDALAPVRAKFGMVFQGAALFDSLTVAENVGFALRRQDVPEDRIARVVEERLRQVGLHGVGARKPGELSGGMKKRVGLARALAVDPEVILYDEPTTGLDPVMADAISELIVGTGKRLGVTQVVVTHDMTSAYKIGSRIAMLYQGKIRVVGTPEAIRKSRDAVVRQFISGSARGPILAKTLA
jgi:phospholipid/cholesterol/gamma-HCH transport system ATP-binding protein